MPAYLGYVDFLLHLELPLKSYPKATEEKIAKEYIEYPSKVKDVERKISEKKFQKLKKELLSFKQKMKKNKKILLILAHQGIKKAISFLEGYSKMAKGDYPSG